MHKNIITASSSGSVLNLNIVGRIYQDEVARVVKMHVDTALANGDTSALVYINSEGGSVFEAQEIVNELKRLPSVKLRVGSLAASAATYIMCHFETECYESSQFMIHKPMSGMMGNEDQMKSELKVIENLTNSYRSAYATKMGKTEDEVEELWKNDYWMDAKEAKSHKLVSTIISEKLAVNESTIAMMVAVGCPVIPTKDTNPNKENMSLIAIAAAIALPATSTEAEVLASVNALKSEKTAAETDRDAWKEKYTSLQKTEATSLVVKAIALGLIPESLKETTVGTFTAEAFDAQKASFEKLISDKEADNLKNGRHSAVASAVAGKASGATAEGDAKDTYDYLQKHNPAELRRIAAEDPAKYQALAADFGKGVRYTK